MFLLYPSLFLLVYVALKAWSELPEGQMAGAGDAFQTPGVCIFPLWFTHLVKYCITLICNSALRIMFAPSG